MKIISKFTLLLVIVAILYLLVTGNLFSLSPIIITIQLLAVTLSVWARRNFQNDQFSIREEPKDGHLLSSGPYHFIRHPMYTSALLLIWAGILGHISPLNLFVGVVVTCLIAIRIVVEEQYLRTSYPDYAEYSRSTKRVIPLII